MLIFDTEPIECSHLIGHMSALLTKRYVYLEIIRQRRIFASRANLIFAQSAQGALRLWKPEYVAVVSDDDGP
jgi:hypothetical protein